MPSVLFFSETNKILNKDYAKINININIKVKALNNGSFEIDLALSQKILERAISLFSVQEVVALNTISYVLTTRRYVSTSSETLGNISFDEKMETLTSELSDLLKNSKKLEMSLRNNLGAIGYEI